MGKRDQKWIEFGKHQNSGFFPLQFSRWEEGEEMMTLVKLPFILQNNNNKKSPLKRNNYPAVNLTNLSLRLISLY